MMCVWHDGVEGSAPHIVFWMPMTLHDVACEAHGAADMSYVRTHARACMHAPHPLASLLPFLPIGLYFPSFALIVGVVWLLRWCPCVPPASA